MNYRRLRPFPQRPALVGNFRFLICLTVIIISSNLSFGQGTFWREGFEQDDFWDRWHVEGGLWAVGVPTSGPNKAFAGDRGAATVLNGDYTPKADARLVRDRVFVVPPATDNPRLRFWHWFRAAEGDIRSVEIKVGTGAWQPIVAVSGWDSDDWSRAWFDLSPFSGQAVQIAFRFQSNPDSEVAAGWYLDEVAVETGPVSSGLFAPEGFESGMGGWTVDHGVWEVGPPSIGPTQAKTGTNSIGTVIDGNYQPNLNSRLISPEFTVPSASENPRLRFWHWFSVWPDDLARVEISVAGSAWVPLSAEYKFNSLVWSRPALNLQAYAGHSIQLAFHFESNSDPNVAAGWYLDDIVLETGPSTWDPVSQPEGFESGLGNWSVDNGTWEEGVPSFGPGTAMAGNRCAGTVLGGTYLGNANSRLISPEFTVPQASERPRLRFWHWLRNQADDPAQVEIRAVGSDWQPLSPVITANDGSWARPEFGLSAFAGQQVQIAFRFQSNDDNRVGAGWFVDDVTVEVGPAKSDLIGKTEGFELGLMDWAVDNGTWEVGPPDTWPETAFSGANCAGTVLGGNYRPDIDSRLISPEFVVPSVHSNPRLRFWHWFSTWPEDSGTVEVSVAGGAWQPLSAPVTGIGVVWTRPWFDLRPFAGQRVRVAFRFQSGPDENVGRGWYVDEVIVETGPSELATFNGSEGFESGLGNWSVENGTWEAGVPASGPGKPFSGANSAATVLSFNWGSYAANTDSRLVSPEVTVPCAEAGPRLRFAHWYDIQPGDSATVEIRVAGGGWEQVLGPMDGLSREWIAGFYDLSPYAGKRIQIAFRFRANEDSLVSSGWYVDEVKVQASMLQGVGETTVSEGALFIYGFGSPCQALRFSLSDPVPAGVNIDPILGIITWLPTEEQGPGVYPIRVCVTDLEHAFSTLECADLEITVTENNSAPVLEPIESKIIQENVALQFTATGYDVDRPAQKLTFSLDQGAPFGATIDAATGVFTWTPTPTQATGRHSISVRVTDDGTPPQSTTVSFTAAPVGEVSEVRLEITRMTKELITICVQGGVLGTIYALETTDDLDGQPNASGWSSLQTIWKGDENFCETTHSTISNARYYRVRRVQ